LLSTDRIYKKYFGTTKHPYKVYEDYVQGRLAESSTLLDAGCGRDAPILKKFIGKAQSLIGVDLEDKGNVPPDILYLQGDISCINVGGSTIDLVMSRAVLEHIEDPVKVFKEINRILKPGGGFIFLAPNLWDYSALFSRLIPNKYHQSVVHKMEGRARKDVFPAYYKANTSSAINKLCAKTNFILTNFRYIGQYPAYFMFNPYLFLIATGYEKLISRYHCLRFLRGWILADVRKGP
jgi:SAM-dependent methyltransferase